MKSVNRIVATYMTAAAAMFPLCVAAEMVSGTVCDTGGEPLIGASVNVTETKKAVATDIEGRFHIDTDGGKAIKVSYIGFVPVQQNIVDGKTEYRFILDEDRQSLDDVVVVGYGTQKRSELTGAISTVRGDAIKDFSTTSVADALAGMAAGVSVTKSTGNPGESPDIIIRGAASVNGMSPLYIVDGVKQATGFSFNTNDIQSIEVLKDAGSCAIYGAEAAGGVILVTTKRGAAGKVRLTLSGRYGIRNQTSGIKLMNPTSS